LRTIVAVFRAEAALGIQQKVQSDSVAPVVMAYLVGSMELSEKFRIGGGQHLMSIVTTYDLTGKGLLSKGIPIGGRQQ
jgi:hypothetical protein